jgi:hypothetical protein
VFIRLCGLIPPYILGVARPLTATGSLVPVLIVLIATIWGFFIHSNLKRRLGLIEWLISTPAFHHWHHTLREPLDRITSPCCLAWIGFSALFIYLAINDHPLTAAPCFASSFAVTAPMPPLAPVITTTLP